MSGAGAKTRIIGLLMVVILVAKPGVALCEMSCPPVVHEVAPCLDYITDKADQPSAECCNGMKTLDGQAKTKPERQAACNCIKDVLKNFQYDSNRLVQLPSKCGLSFTIPPDLDCSKISA